MTLKVDKEQNRGKTDYNVIVKYNEQTLEVFPMSWLIQKMFREGPQCFSETVWKILNVHGINDLTIEEVESQLRKFK